MSILLDVKGRTKRYGGLTANSDITFDVNQGEILGIIGPNGAGKSTLFDLITGFQPLDAGRVFLDGHEITGLRPDRIASRGVARTFQKLEPFPDLTVTENVIVGALVRTGDMKQARDHALERWRSSTCWRSATTSPASSPPASASAWSSPAASP